MQNLPDLASEEDAAQEHTYQHSLRQVVRRHNHDDGQDHYDAGARRMNAQFTYRVPVERAERHHDHHRDQRGHWDSLDPLTQE